MARRLVGFVTVERAGDDPWAPGGEPEPGCVGRIAAMVGVDRGCDDLGAFGIDCRQPP